MFLKKMSALGTRTWVHMGPGSSHGADIFFEKICEKKCIFEIVSLFALSRRLYKMVAIQKVSGKKVTTVAVVHKKKEEVVPEVPAPEEESPSGIPPGRKRRFRYKF